MRKGKSHSVQFVSHNGNAKKKFSNLKDKKFQFKKNGSFYSSQYFGQHSSMHFCKHFGQHSRDSFDKPKYKFNGKCKFCDAFGHKQADCWKFKNWLEKKKGTPLALVCFESIFFKVPSHTCWLDTCVTIHVSSSLQKFTS